MAIGYDDGSAQFTVRNSRGSSWGLDGYFNLPYGYVWSHRLAGDFWTIRTVE